MPIPALWCRLAIPPVTAGRQVTTRTCPQVGCRNLRATASRSTYSPDLKHVRRAGMMVFSMILWMSVGHKLAHRCARRLACAAASPHTHAPHGALVFERASSGSSLHKQRFAPGQL